MILVVEDDNDLRVLISQRLQTVTHREIIDSGSVAEALELLKAKKIELVVSDFNMRPQNGIDLLLKIIELGLDPYFIIFSHTLEQLSIPQYAKFLGVIDKSNFSELTIRINSI